MANKRIDELISKAIIDANDLVFVGDPLTGWLYKATVADLQAGVTGGIGGSGTANFIPKFATANTIGNSTIFDNGTSVAIGTTTPNASFKFVVNGNVSFGEYGLNTGFVSFDTTPTNTPTSAGTLSWNDTDGTLDLKLKGGNVTNQIGQEINKRVVNKSGATLNEADFRAVRIRLVSEGGAQGQRLAVVLAQADNDTNSATTIGLVTETIANNDEGFITLIGEVKEIDTTGAKSYGGTETWADGDILYLSPTHAGYLTNVKPQAPQHTIVVGFVSYAHAIHGKIDVKVDNGYELDELHNVKINTPLHNQALIFNSSDNTWRNRTIIKTDGYVPYFDQSSLFLDSPLYTNGTKVAIGTNSFIGTNLLSVQGGIYSEEHTINGNLLIHSNTLSGNAFISRWSGTTWDVEQTFYSDHILFSKDIESTKFTKTGGTSAQFLMADGSTATTSSLSLLTGPGTQNYIAKFYDASGLAMYNSQLYDNGTNVGIGTTSPFKKFTVQGGAISVYSSSTNYGFMDTSNNSFSFTSANGFYFVANNIGTVASTYVDTTGKWGFGVGTPSYKVDVNGDINTNGIYRISGSPLSTTNIAEGTNLYFTSNRVLGQVLTGLNTSLNGLITSADSLIVGISKLQNQVSSIVSGVSSVFGRTGAVTAASGDYNTSQVTESTNLYYTQARFDSAFGAKSTTNLAEGTNLYYTDARARLAHSFVAGSGDYNSTTGVITIPTNTNQLTNGAGFITSSALSSYLPLSGGTMTGVITTPNNTFGIIIGDDSRLADRNIANTLFIEGNQNNDRGYINFSSTSGNSLGAIAGGALTWNGNTILTSTNYNLYSVPLTRTITINGTTQDLSADRTFTIAGTISGLTTNYIPKATSATTIGNSNLQEVSGNLGLGVTPSAWASGFTALQVKNATFWSTGSDASITANAYFNGTSYIYSTTNGSSRTYHNIDGSISWFQAPSGTAGTAISFTQAMTLDASGRLGVGTTSPINRLDVLESTSNTYGIISARGNNRGGALELYNGNTITAAIYSLTTNDLIFYRGSYSESMRITSTGNVSIGNTNNTYKLDVSGVLKVASDTSPSIFNTATGQGIAIENSGASNKRYRLNVDGTSFLITEAGVGSPLTIASGGAATFSSSVTAYNYFRANSSTIGGFFQSYDGTNEVDLGSWKSIIGSGNSYDALIYSSNASSSFYVMTGGNITPKFSITSTGNVGIGTTSPTRKLHVNGDFTVNNGASQYYGVYISGGEGSSPNILIGDWYDSRGNILWDSTNKYLRIDSRYGTGGADIIFSGNSTERMRITSGGNVLVSTTSDNGFGYLQIGGSSSNKISLTGGTSQNGMRWESVGGANTFYIFNGTFGSAGWGVYNVNTNSSPFWIQNGGNVGIGTTSPTEKLEVNGNIKINNGAADGGQLVLSSSGYSDWNIDNYSGGLRAYYGSTEYLRLTSSGYLGLATGSPSAQLHVASGNVVIGGNPSVQFKLNVQGVSGYYISMWTPTINGVNTNGFISHGGGGYSDQKTMGYFASAHYFNLSSDLTNGGLIQVGGSINITGSFMVNGVPITSGGGATSLAGLTDVAITSPSTGQILVYDASVSKWKNQANTVSGVTGSGTSGYIPLWSGATSLGNSSITQSVNSIKIGGSSAWGYLSNYLNIVAEFSLLDVIGSWYRTARMSGAGAVEWVSAYNTAQLSAAGNWLNASDISFKKNVVDIKYSVNDIIKLKPRNYDMKADDSKHIGFIAQELIEIIPEVVEKGSDDKLMVDYGALVSLAIQGIKELKAEIEVLKSK